MTPLGAIYCADRGGDADCLGYLDHERGAKAAHCAGTGKVIGGIERDAVKLGWDQPTRLIQTGPTAFQRRHGKGHLAWCRGLGGDRKEKKGGR